MAVTGTGYQDWILSQSDSSGLKYRLEHVDGCLNYSYRDPDLIPRL